MTGNQHKDIFDQNTQIISEYIQEIYNSFYNTENNVFLKICIHILIIWNNYRKILIVR
jgi:hypothetical protein